MREGAGIVSGSDHDVAADVARQAGRLLVGLREEMVAEDPARLRAEGDRRSHELIARLLREVRPHDARLSEEAVDDRARLRARRVWIVDPLDGTREYAEPGRTDWAVHVALWEQHDLVAGAVALPALGRVYATPVVARGERGHRDVPCLRVAVSRTRPLDFVRELCDRLGAVPVPLGSAGAKAMAVVDGTADAYVHGGGQYEWDSAAPVAVARAAGLHASRLDGTPLRYNQPNPYLPDLLISRDEAVHELIRETLASTHAAADASEAGARVSDASPSPGSSTSAS